MDHARLAEFRKKLNAGGVYGPFSKTEDPAVIECLGLSGFDFCIIDLEHGPNTLRSAQNLVRAAELSGMLPIIRLPENSHNRIGAVLDIGAAGVQIPLITTAEMATDAVSKARFAPLGHRGVCRFVRNAQYSATPKAAYFSEANSALVIIQLEGKDALDNLDEILAVAGIDIVFIGPYDLSQSLGVTGQICHPTVVAAVHEISQKCRARGLAAGTFVESVADAKHWRSCGLQYLCYSVDIGILYEHCRGVLAELSN